MLMHDVTMPTKSVFKLHRKKLQSLVSYVTISFFPANLNKTRESKQDAIDSV